VSALTIPSPAAPLLLMPPKPCPLGLLIWEREYDEFPDEREVRYLSCDSWDLDQDMPDHVRQWGRIGVAHAQLDTSGRQEWWKEEDGRPAWRHVYVLFVPSRLNRRIAASLCRRIRRSRPGLPALVEAHESSRMLHIRIDKGFTVLWRNWAGGLELIGGAK
jgi:hypothetical protein